MQSGAKRTQCLGIRLPADLLSHRSERIVSRQDRLEFTSCLERLSQSVCSNIESLTALRWGHFTLPLMDRTQFFVGLVNELLGGRMRPKRIDLFAQHPSRFAISVGHFGFQTPPSHGQEHASCCQKGAKNENLF